MTPEIKHKGLEHIACIWLSLLASVLLTNLGTWAASPNVPAAHARLTSAVVHLCYDIPIFVFRWHLYTASMLILSISIRRKFLHHLVPLTLCSGTRFLPTRSSSLKLHFHTCHLKRSPLSMVSLAISNSYSHSHPHLFQLQYPLLIETTRRPKRQSLCTNKMRPSKNIPHKSSPSNP